MFLRWPGLVRSTTTRNRRDDGEFVASGDGGVLLGREVPQIFVVDVDVDEGAELALCSEELLLEFRKLRGERGQDVGDGCSRDADRLGSAGVDAERCGDVDVHA